MYCNVINIREVKRGQFWDEAFGNYGVNIIPVLAADWFILKRLNIWGVAEYPVVYDIDSEINDKEGALHVGWWSWLNNDNGYQTMATSPTPWVRVDYGAFILSALPQD